MRHCRLFHRGEVLATLPAPNFTTSSWHFWCIRCGEAWGKLESSDPRCSHFTHEHLCDRHASAGHYHSTQRVPGSFLDPHFVWYPTEPQALARLLVAAPQWARYEARLHALANRPMPVEELY